jgi:glutamine synthetase
MLEMAMRDYIPAVTKYIGDVSSSISSLASVLPKAKLAKEKAHLEKLTNLLSSVYEAHSELYELEEMATKILSTEEAAFFYCNNVGAAMDKLRYYVDELEEITAREYWPVPTYGDMTYGEIL